MASWADTRTELCLRTDAGVPTLDDATEELEDTRDPVTGLVEVGLLGVAAAAAEEEEDEVATPDLLEMLGRVGVPKLGDDVPEDAAVDDTPPVLLLSRRAVGAPAPGVDGVGSPALAEDAEEVGREAICEMDQRCVRLS